MMIKSRSEVRNLQLRTNARRLIKLDCPNFCNVTAYDMAAARAATNILPSLQTLPVTCNTTPKESRQVPGSGLDGVLALWQTDRQTE